MECAFNAFTPHTAETYIAAINKNIPGTFFLCFSFTDGTPALEDWLSLTSSCRSPPDCLHPTCMGLVKIGTNHSAMISPKHGRCSPETSLLDPRCVYNNFLLQVLGWGGGGELWGQNYLHAHILWRFRHALHETKKPALQSRVLGGVRSPQLLFILISRLISLNVQACCPGHTPQLYELTS